MYSAFKLFKKKSFNNKEKKILFFVVLNVEFFHGFSLRKDKTLFSLEGDFKVVVLDPEFLSTSSNPGGGVILLPRVYELGKD